MTEFDPGHKFSLDVFDDSSNTLREFLTFVKREGSGYPGNKGHYPGTNCQEVLRVLIARVKYLDGQIPHWTNQVVLFCLRISLNCFEYRAAKRHKRMFDFVYKIECLGTNQKDGHVYYD